MTKGGSQLFSKGRLQQVLEDVHMLKVGHNLQANTSTLFAEHSILLNHIFNTQVGKQNQVVLNPMLKLYANSQNKLKKAVKKAWTRD
ncbi:uncharacterized protein ACA1_349110 [Acanthamoeba castellanii str. Neff]|uniref:Uncharacterized protein n=1 Tax=Acanthamoeba castellanii (strain ATCC 30010 / Neff) TaxID=1257118 RepID=L8GTZ8_ACACF|nr:uncharacterized protein ACA1_349110 [Acanthamoeba castellanii str. Neff]ELR16495.1 hypothetical protein ACA1_349110 [Acanthamoeba castellanii str. Neff]